ncbi:hypothetical protein ACWDQL_04620 [Streptomyces olivaceus]
MPSKKPGPPGPAAVLCGPAGWAPPGVVTNDDLAVRLHTDDPGLPRERCVAKPRHRRPCRRPATETDPSVTTYEQIVDVVLKLHDVPAELIRPEATLGAIADLVDSRRTTNV